MKLSYKAWALALALAGGFSSCADFLDIVPDENTTDRDTYSGRDRGLGFLYSCYAYLPNPAGTVGGLDLFTGDEVVTAFEHELFSGFPKGNYTASSPVISYWDTLFQGIRQCYVFLERIDALPATTTPEEKADYKAQIKFLIAYYHYQLFRCYGPILLIKELPDANAAVKDFPERRPLDECVEWIAAQLDEAAAGLPATRNTGSVLGGQSFYGLATSVMAKSVKAKLYLYAASPLFNGGTDYYTEFKNAEGQHLMPQTYDPQKWERARVAIKEAITLAESNGHALYTNEAYRSTDQSANAYPEVGTVRKMRTLTLDWKSGPNPEVLMADTRGEGYYDIQLKCSPRITNRGQGANGTSVTWAMLNRFYTKNGLPWDEDPAYKDTQKLSVVTIGADHAAYAKEGAQTVAFNLNREPRFYAWVGFHNGYYEILKGNGNTYDAARMPQRGRVLLNFLKDGFNGRMSSGAGSSNNYSPGGYLNKKGTDPNMIMNESGPQRLVYPWPVIRLADLYLAYAEACVETSQLDEAKKYLDYVRVRAGIPTVETSWSGVAALTQDKLRQIVRQERQIELYLENQNFWDMRRWLLAEQAFGVKAQGMNIESKTLEGFAQLTTIPYERKFEAPKNYLLPIPSADINRNPKLIQNPGY